ncbi:MAG: hypothetical protein WCX71_03190 [Candidatus Buchananbacteria bacterium]
MSKKILGLEFFLIGVMIFAGAGCAKQEAATDNANNPKTNEVTQEKAPAVADQTMVDCGQGQDQFCFVNRMNECLPAKVRMTGNDGKTSIDLIILGVENETCHFQRKINDVLNLNCFFPKGTFNTDTLDQTFGNDKGLQKVVDSACKSGW